MLATIPPREICTYYNMIIYLNFIDVNYFASDKTLWLITMIFSYGSFQFVLRFSVELSAAAKDGLVVETFIIICLSVVII